MNNKPLVSILMNCYNGGKYLNESIDSIINQTYLNWELVFWDNQSTDNSKEIVDSYQDDRIKYFYAPEHTDLGGGRARAFEHLRGDYIAILDTDDVWMSEKIEKQLELFDSDSVGIVISNTLFFNEKSERVLYDKNYPPEGNVFCSLLAQYFVSLETVMLRKSIVDKLDYGFDPEFSFIADFDLVLRVSKISKLMICKEVLAKWRVHEESDSWQSYEYFSTEKLRWILKQEKQCINFFKGCESDFLIMKNKVFLQGSIALLMKKQHVQAFRLIIKAGFKEWRNYVIIFLCCIPLSSYILLFLQNRRVKRLLR
jgi:glycosyltransferase involved in cell wall biosynthesis